MFFSKEDMVSFKSFDGSIDDYIKNTMTKAKEEKINKEAIHVIRDAVAQYFGVDESFIVKKTNKRKHAFPRQITHYLAYYYTPLSLDDIGRTLGGRDHSTVLHSKKTISNYIDVDINVACHLLNIENDLASRGLKRLFKTSRLTV